MRSSQSVLRLDVEDDIAVRRGLAPKGLVVRRGPNDFGRDRESVVRDLDFHTPMKRRNTRQVLVILRQLCIDEPEPGLQPNVVREPEVRLGVEADETAIPLLELREAEPLHDLVLDRGENEIPPVTERTYRRKDVHRDCRGTGEGLQGRHQLSVFCPRCTAK